MDGFQEIHCPQCGKKLPFQVFGITSHQIIRYQCRKCKSLIYVKEGLVPVVVTTKHPSQSIPHLD